MIVFTRLFTLLAVLATSFSIYASTPSASVRSGDDSPTKIEVGEIDFKIPHNGDDDKDVAPSTSTMPVCGISGGAHTFVGSPECICGPD